MTKKDHVDCDLCKGKGFFECQGWSWLDCEQITVTHYHFCYETNQTGNSKGTEKT